MLSAEELSKIPCRLKLAPSIGSCFAVVFYSSSLKHNNGFHVHAVFQSRTEAVEYARSWSGPHALRPDAPPETDDFIHFKPMKCSVTLWDQGCDYYFDYGKDEEDEEFRTFLGVHGFTPDEFENSTPERVAANRVCVLELPLIGKKD